MITVKSNSVNSEVTVFSNSGSISYTNPTTQTTDIIDVGTHKNITIENIMDHVNLTINGGIIF